MSVILQDLCSEKVKAMKTKSELHGSQILLQDSKILVRQIFPHKEKYTGDWYISV